MPVALQRPFGQDVAVVGVEGAQTGRLTRPLAGDQRPARLRGAPGSGAGGGCAATGRRGAQAAVLLQIGGRGDQHARHSAACSEIRLRSCITAMRTAMSTPSANRSTTWSDEARRTSTSGCGGGIRRVHRGQEAAAEAERRGDPKRPGGHARRHRHAASWPSLPLPARPKRVHGKMRPGFGRLLTARGAVEQTGSHLLF